MSSSPRIGILGAGPAGTSAAIMLAKAGISVDLIDKATFPRDKICGDALSLDVINQLGWISPELRASFDSYVPKEPSGGVSIFSPNLQRVDIPFIREGQAKHGYVAKRLDFDQALLQEALSYAQVSFSQGQTIRKLSRKGSQIHLQSTDYEQDFDLVLGADGAHSIIARQLAGQQMQRAHYSAGIRRYFEGVEGFHQEGFIELYFFKKILPGYLWIFKLPNGQANVGIGMLSSALERKKLNLKKVMDELIQEEPSLKERFKNAKALEEPRGFGLPLGSTKRPISGDSYLLLGDAAGLIDPFSGEGIANAMRSGRVAAEHIIHLIQQDKAFTAANNLAYDEEIWKRVWPELRLSARLQQLCRYPRLFNMVCRKARANNQVHQFLIDALSEVSIKKQLTRPTFYWNLLLS